MMAPPTVVLLPSHSILVNSVPDSGASNSNTVLVVDNKPSSAFINFVVTSRQFLCSFVAGIVSKHVWNKMNTLWANVDPFNANPWTKDSLQSTSPTLPNFSALSTDKPPVPENNNSEPLAVKNNGWNAEALDAVIALNARTANSAAKASLMIFICFSLSICQRGRSKADENGTPRPTIVSSAFLTRRRSRGSEAARRPSSAADCSSRPRVPFSLLFRSITLGGQEQPGQGFGPGTAGGRMGPWPLLR